MIRRHGRPRHPDELRADCQLPRNPVCRFAGTGSLPAASFAFPAADGGLTCPGVSEVLARLAGAPAESAPCVGCWAAGASGFARRHCVGRRTSTVSALTRVDGGDTWPLGPDGPHAAPPPPPPGLGEGPAGDPCSRGSGSGTATHPPPDAAPPAPSPAAWPVVIAAPFAASIFAPSATPPAAAAPPECALAPVLQLYLPRRRR